MHKNCVSDAAQVRDMIRGALHGRPDAQWLHRLDGVLLVAEGRSCSEVAGWFGVNRRTVERWIHSAAAQGMAGLADHPHGGRPARLSNAQLQALAPDLLASPAALGYPDRQWNGKRLALHLAGRYGLVVSVRSCQRLIARSICWHGAEIS